MRRVHHSGDISETKLMTAPLRWPVLWAGLAALMCAAAAFVAFVIWLPAWERGSGKTLDFPRLATASNIDLPRRSDLFARSPQDLARRFGIAPYRDVVMDARIFPEVAGDRASKQASWAFVLRPKSIGGDLCEVQVVAVNLKDTYVFPVGWRLSAVEDSLGSRPGYVAMSGQQLPDGQPSTARNCTSYRDMSHLFSADSAALALRGATLARMILAQKSSAFRGFSIRCTTLASVVSAKPCDALGMPSELSWSWFAQVISQPSAGSNCEGSAETTVLLFQDPKNRHQYPITEFDLDVCSAPSPGMPSGERILSVTVTEDDIV